MKIVINGQFLEEGMQGIVRYATLMTLNLDKLITDKDDVILLCPKNVSFPYELKNIKVINYGKNRGVKWELFDLKKYLKNKDYYCLNMCNVSPLLKKNVVTTIHDVMYRSDFKNYRTIKNRLSAIWHRYQYRFNAKYATKIITVSEYSKNEIIKYYPKSKGKIEITPNGWDHVLSWKEDKDWDKKYPFLKSKNYYFSLATLAKNKNGSWIIEVAKRNPDSTFAIAGKFYNDSSMMAEKIPGNVHLLGFVNDDIACSLIKNCKAFLFPSINEGFGIPPLEALGLGAVVVSSNVSAMPGVLGDSVHYINPYDYDVDLDALLKEKIKPSRDVTSEYTWKKASVKMYSILSNL